MASVLDALVAAFLEHRQRIAVLDRAAREATGQWHLDRSIPVAPIVETFAERPELRVDGYAVLPLHEPDSAELTGEFFLLDRSSGRSHLMYYDFGAGSLVGLSVDAAAGTYPSWRFRFWHPDYVPPRAPSFVRDHLEADQPTSPPTPTSSPSSSTPIDGETFFEELALFVQRERDASRERTKERYARLTGARFPAGVRGIDRALPAGREVDEEGTQTCLLTIPDRGRVDGDASPLPLTEGVEVLVDTHDHRAGFPVEGVVQDATGDTIALWMRWSTASDHAAAEAAFDAGSEVTFRVIELLNPVPYERQQRAIESVAGSEEKRALLLGTAQPSYSERSRIDPATRHRLNQYQLQALRSGLEAEDLHLIHGPPGTGKTRTLVHLIREAVYDGARVLACAHSNQAVDNLLVGASGPDRVDPGSLHAAVEDGAFEMARAGNNSSNSLVRERYMDREVWGAAVVGATTSAAHRFQPDQFDLVVIDEATQATIPSSLIPYSKGQRLVLAGDHRQLPPYVSSEFDDSEAMEISLFEHVLSLYGDAVATMLRRQYRMHEAIAAFPNEHFYGGKLHHGQRNRDWTIADLDPLEALDVPGQEQQTPAGSYYNEAEVKAVETEVSRLLAAGVLPDQIGVITPYSGQVGKITAALPDDVLERGLDVATIDAFQGSEREAIVVSFVRSNENDSIGFLGFPEEGPRRLNVALTRARKRCVLIGDWDTLASERVDAPAFEALRDHLERKAVLNESP